MKTKVTLLFFAFVILFIPLSQSQSISSGQDTRTESLQIFPVYQDISPPLRDMVPSVPSGKIKPEYNKPAKERVYPLADVALPQGPDPVWQKQNGTELPDKSPLINVEGIPHQPYCGSPSDCNGTAGLNHFVQIVNSNYQVFDKEGNTVLGPIYSNTIWQGLPGADDPGPDPIVLWDDQAQRWFIGHMGSGGNYLLMAVSVTSDPTGSYYRYSWNWPALPDYPKFGIWRDGYYCSLQCSSWDICVFNRTAMLSGGSVSGWLVDNPITNSGGGLCVADNDGAWSPSGSPGLFLTINDDAWGGNDELWIYNMDVDWGSPGGVTFNRTQQLPVAAFDGNLGAFRQNIRQKNTTQKIDGIPMVLMFRCQYRNFGSYQSIVCCHTVDVDNTDHAGIRWYELRKTSGNWYVYQQGTYAPDAHSRWMGSIAQNQYGDIAIGYSVSSSTKFPSIAYAGRRKTDALGTMSISEQYIWNGTQSQVDGDRWGDYSAISVDPADDKTFWYTTMYSNGSAFTWRTRVAAFSFGAHCIASGGCWKYIERVQAGSIDNTTDCNEYADYSSTLSTNVALNGGVLVKVTNVGFVVNTDQCGVWVDWNRDRDFYDANEAISVPGSPGNGPYSVVVIPPAGATTGECTMRIRVASAGTLSPCGVLENGEVEDYTLNLVAASTSNTWTGLVSNDWTDIANWSLCHEALETENVTIPSGTPYPASILAGTTAYCKNLTVTGGATLTQTGTSYLYIYGNMNTDAGQYTSSGLAYLYFDGSISTTWDDDNTNDVYQNVRVYKDVSTAYVNMWQDMNVYNFEIREGEFRIDGTWTLTVNSTGTNAFEVESGGKLTLADENIDVAGRVTFLDGSQASIGGGSIRCGGDFRVESNAAYNIIFTDGSLIMDGSSTQYIHDLDGGTLDLYNLVIDKSGGTCYIGDANLDVNGNLTIESGTFSCNNAPAPTATYNIYLAGNWTNNAGSAYFEESTGKVVFNGANAAMIGSDELFYNVDLSKTYAGMSGLTSSYNITVLNNLIIADGTFSLNLPAKLTIAGYLMIDADAGLNASSGSEVYIAGDWMNMNTGYSTTTGFYPGLHTIFNGSTDQVLMSNSLYETFQNLVINKSAGRFRSNNNILCLQDLLIQNGIWEDNTTLLTHKFYRNFTVDVNGVFKTDINPNTVYFGGESDAAITYQGNSGYLYNIILDKSFDDQSTLSDQGNDNTEGGKSFSLSLGSDIPVMGDAINVIAGDFNFNGHSIATSANISINSGGRIYMPAGSGLKMSHGKSLRVLSGGSIELNGTIGNPVLVTSNSGSEYYIFEVENGGNISAERAVFEQMNANGIFLMPGSLVNPAHAFNYCTFRNQPAGNAALLTIHNSQDFTVYGAGFPENTWGGTNNVRKDVNTGHVLFDQASGLFSGPLYEYDPYGRIDWTDASLSLSLTVMMEGPFWGGIMYTSLNPSVPLTQPFNPPLPYFGNPMPEWYYEGTESVATLPSANVVDWILVELRDAPTAITATASTMIARKAAFLMNDGSIVDMDGTNVLHFNASILQNLFVVIWHRNHLGIMSSLPLSQTGGIYTYNFTTDASMVYGGATGHKQIGAGIWGMISGDGNADGIVSNTDKANVWQVQVGLSGYYAGDFNMNGQVDNSDKAVKWKPNSGAGSQVPDSMTPPGGYKCLVPD